MIFSLLLNVSLGIFVIGLIYKVSTWFTRQVGISNDISASKRVMSFIKGFLGVIFSFKFVILIKVFLLDVMLQQRILKQDFMRWIMHMLIFYGFMILLLMHGLEAVITENLFDDYYSTLNPFMFIRDLAGSLVIAGVALAIYRRFFMRLPRLITSPMDHYAIAVVAVIILSGIALEGAKITSRTEFKNMVDEYAFLDDEDEDYKALESYWVSNFALVSPDVKGPFDSSILAQGKEVNETSCAECHSSPKWAFTGYATAKILTPAALFIDHVKGPRILWWIHIIACFLGLAYLPFSKMFHIIASPISLLVNAVMNKNQSDPANIATRQVMELDACTHCGACTLACSVGITFEIFKNRGILPSEKIHLIKALAKGKPLTRKELMDIQEGLYLCTNCHHCTDVCPVGINLEELWFNVREALLQKGNPEFLTLSGLSYYRAFRSNDLKADQYRLPPETAKKALVDECKLIDMTKAVATPTDSGSVARKRLFKSSQGSTFSYCFTCTTCSTVCPVAENYNNDLDALGLVPHQIIHAAIFGITEVVLSSNMLWSCLGCYECQQHCPQGVRITDVFYELKNIAFEQMQGKLPISREEN
jgi:heterodisulfide reductase subunit C